MPPKHHQNTLRNTLGNKREENKAIKTIKTKDIKQQTN
jgi:hypothetical protein